MAVALLLAAVAGACVGPVPTARPAKPRVVVSLPPLAWVVERLAADRVDVTVLLPPAAAPESWSASPASLLAVVEADLFFGVGHPAIGFEGRLMRQASSAGAATLTLAEGREASVAAVPDPHLWLDPDLVATSLPGLVKLLGRLDPSGAELFADNARDLAGAIAALDELIGDALAGRRRDLIVVQHAAWSRLLGRYGVSEESIELEGKGPEPGRMVGLVETARRAEVPTVFSQRGFADRGARLIAGELGAEVVVLDPLAREWLSNLEHAVQMFAAAVD